MKNLLTLSIIISTIFLSFIPAFPQASEKNTLLSITVDDVRLIAINNNLDIKLAKLDSKIKGTELSYKEAVFDTILNGTIDYTDDQRKQASTIYGSQSTLNNYNIGLDKKLQSGTDVGIDFTNKREWTNSSFVSTNPYHESQIEISLRQPIAKNFFGLIDRGDVEIIKWEIKNADLDSYIKIEDAMISAEKAYWGLVLAKEEFKIKKEMFKKAMLLFSQHRRKLRIGLVEIGEALASEANMHIRENDLLIASNQLKTAEELLRVHLNLGNDIRLSPLDSLSATNFDTTLIKSLEEAFRNRRDYIAKANDIEARKIKLKMKSNSRFPQIDLKTTFATNDIDTKYYRAVEDIFQDSNPAYYVGIEFEYPLENNKANSEYEKASLEKAKAILNLQKTEREICSDIDKRFRNLSIDKIKISKMTRVENLQKGKLSHEEKRFRYGRSDSDTLIRYQEDLLNASLARQKAYFDYTISILDLMGDEDSFLKYIGLE